MRADPNLDASSDAEIPGSRALRAPRNDSKPSDLPPQGLKLLAESAKSPPVRSIAISLLLLWASAEPVLLT
jgi:hypothetical protein